MSNVLKSIINSSSNNCTKEKNHKASTICNMIRRMHRTRNFRTPKLSDANKHRLQTLACSVIQLVPLWVNVLEVAFFVVNCDFSSVTKRSPKYALNIAFPSSKIELTQEPQENQTENPLSHNTR